MERATADARLYLTSAVLGLDRPSDCQKGDWPRQSGRGGMGEFGSDFHFWADWRGAKACAWCSKNKTE